MTVVELIEKVKNRPVPTIEQLDNFIARVKEKEAEYSDYAERTKVTSESLNRIYTM